MILGGSRSLIGFYRGWRRGRVQLVGSGRGYWVRLGVFHALHFGQHDPVEDLPLFLTRLSGNRSKPLDGVVCGSSDREIGHVFPPVGTDVGTWVQAVGTALPLLVVPPVGTACTHVPTLACGYMYPQVPTKMWVQAAFRRFWCGYVHISKCICRIRVMTICSDTGSTRDHRGPRLIGQILASGPLRVAKKRRIHGRRRRFEMIAFAWSGVASNSSISVDRLSWSVGTLVSTSLLVARETERISTAFLCGIPGERGITRDTPNSQGDRERRSDTGDQERPGDHRTPYRFPGHRRVPTREILRQDRARTDWRRKEPVLARSRVGFPLDSPP